MKITLDQIRREAEKQGWKVNSTKYVNLTTDMEFECPNGHQVVLPYKKLRDKFCCPQCNTNPLKDLKLAPIEKNGAKRILALDQATKITGWSLWDDETLVQYGLFRTKAKTSVDRLSEIHQWLNQLVGIYKPDLVLLEDIQYQEKVEGKTVFNGNAVNGVTVYKTLAELLGVLQVSLREQGVDFEVVSSSVWRKEIGIKGKMRSEKKQSAQKQVKEWFNIDVSEDEADAICIGQYAVRKHKTVKMFQWG